MILIVALVLARVVAPVKLEAQPAGSDTSHRFIDFTVGMGIDMHSANSIVNYINFVAQPVIGEKVNTYSSAVEFYAVPEVQVSQDWSVGVEYGLLIKSYTIDDQSGYSRSEFSYQVHMPTVLVHRLLIGEGYRVKLGGGIGYHFANFTQSFSSLGSEGTLSARGPGIKLDAIGNTKFDETFYGSIGVDVRWDFVGPLKAGSGGSAATSSAVPLPKMDFFSVGLKFGVTFQLH